MAVSESNISPTGHKVSCSHKLLAVASGIGCHSLFLLAIGLMALSIYRGMNFGVGHFHGPGLWLADMFLLLQFPLLHSFLLTSKGAVVLCLGKRSSVAKILSPTTFALIASLQIGATFLLWTPLGVTLWETSGLPRIVFILTYFASWCLLAKAMFDADITLQTGFKGWWALYRGERPKYLSFPRAGTFQIIRQPIYLAFLGILLSSPSWTLDRVLLIMVWGGYCLCGPLFKERRYGRRFGEEFRRYQQAVPYMNPLHKAQVGSLGIREV